MVNSTHTASSDEMREWYYGHLRPKLARATQAGVVPSPQAMAFDRDLRGLLARAGERGEEGA